MKLSANVPRAGLAMDCGTLRRLVYSLATSILLALAGMFFVENERTVIYSFAISLIPASVMLTTVVQAVRCNRSLKVRPKETIVVGVKNAVDTLQLLELTAAGRQMDPLVGTYRFCLQSKFLLLYGLTSYSIMLIALPIVIPYLMGEDANISSIVVMMVFTPMFLLAFMVEYYTCCKMKYPVKKSGIFNAKIVRCPWVSYLELELNEESK